MAERRAVFSRSAAVLATLLLCAGQAVAAVSCEWATPGHDRLTVARVLVIAKMNGLTLSEKVRAGIALAQAPADRVMIWRDSITSTTRRMDYQPGLYQMGFGRGRVCDITRLSWSEYQAEPASAWPIGGGKCLLAADVCGNPAWTHCEPGRIAGMGGAQSVPEPGTLAMVLMALGLLWWRVRLMEC